MKKVYLIRFALDSKVQQPEMIQSLKNEGAEVIQTSAGLCVKTEKSQSELESSIGASGVSIEPMSQEKLKDQAESVKAFVGGQ